MTFIKSMLLPAIVAISVSGCFSMITFEPFDIVKVVDLKNIEQADIFVGSRQWFSESFVSNKSIVGYEDEKLGVIIGNGVSEVGSDPFGLISYGMSYSFRVDTKKGKLKVTTKINKLTNTDSSGTYEAVNISPERISEAEDSISLMVKSLKVYIQRQGRTEW
jgi:hypothetical protein